MAEHRQPNLEDEGAKSSFQKTVVLRDWWLIKCSNEFQGKRFGVAGTEDPVETRAMRVFTSSPIIKALDVFTLLASDGIYITLRGFLNKERLVKSGFIPQISREFIFGFPPCWERICNSCFGGDSSGTDKNTIPSKIDKVCSLILSPCKNMKRNQEDHPAETRDKSTVTETNTGEIDIKDGSRARDQKTGRRKSIPRLSKSGGKGLNKAKSSDVEKDKCEAIDSEDLGKSSKPGKRGIAKRSGNTLKRDSNVVEPMNYSGTKVKSAKDKRKLDVSKVQNLTTNAKDYGKECLNKAKRNDVEVISSVDACGKRHLGTDGIEKLTSKNATKESEQRKGRVKVTKKSLHSLPKDLNNSRKPESEGKSKKREKALKSDSNVAEENLSRETEENLSWGKTKRKIDFDVEVTPEKETKKQNTNVLSTDSLGQKRSRSGRVLVSSLEFWRNQIPVYDMDRNLIQVKEGLETKGKGSDSRKRRR